VESAYPRASYANARAAYEAAQDAVLSASDPAAYNSSGAIALCVELVEHEELQKRWDDACAEWGIKKDRTKRLSPESLIEAAAAQLDEMRSGSAQLLRNALLEAKSRAEQSSTGPGKVGAK